jgi:hypothetical protein
MFDYEVCATYSKYIRYVDDKNAVPPKADTGVSASAFTPSSVEIEDSGPLFRQTIIISG